MAQDGRMNDKNPERQAPTGINAELGTVRPITGGQRAVALAYRIVLAFAVVWAVHILYQWLAGMTAQAEGGAQIRLGLIIVMLTVYAILIALPFVPGIEIGIMLLMLQGGQIAPAVYGATVAGLCIAFAVGHWLPLRVLEHFLKDLRLHRAAVLVREIGQQSPQRRLVRLRATLPLRFAKHLIRQRYLLLALLINLPGNALVGGGGGIALTSGLSKLYAPLPTLITFLLAVSPIPILVWLFDRPMLPMIG